MRRLPVVALLALLVAGFVTPASAAPRSLGPQAATFAGQWLAKQLTAQGFIPQAADPNAPNLSATAQAVIALAAAGAPQYSNALDYLGGHVEEFVVSSGNDDPGALSYLIMDAVIGGQDPTNFGTTRTDLVARLQATKQANGLFGANDPSFDGAFRQGLSLMALKAIGLTDATATDWLAGQQCADGLWTAFRADTTTPCPAVDPSTFTGPDTNSTALAVLGLHAQGRTTPATDGANALLNVRSAGGGWGFLARSDQPTDANSTGLVLTALLAATGSPDQQGKAAVLALQADCSASNSADVGGISFQDVSSGPDVLATVQATPALADAVLPVGKAPVTAADAACAAPITSTSTTATDSPTSTTPPAVEGQPLPRTGSWSGLEVGTALVLVGLGVVLVQRAETRRRRHA